LIDTKSLVFVHYMGAKPWFTDLKQRQAADWEANTPAYEALEAFWWRVKRGEVREGELLQHVPRAFNN
jgi:hypothetical protein